MEEQKCILKIKGRVSEKNICEVIDIVTDLERKGFEMVQFQRLDGDDLVLFQCLMEKDYE
jgi:hypothetical protein